MAVRAGWKGPAHLSRSGFSGAPAHFFGAANRAWGAVAHVFGEV